MRHARSRCEQFESDEVSDLWQAVHDGYLHLPDPVSHRRRIAYDKARRIFRVQDFLDCKGRHDAEVLWHFAPECEFGVGRHSIDAIREDVRVRMSVSGVEWQPVIVQGEMDPPQGWLSRRYGVRVPAPVVIWRGQFSGSLSLVTEFAIDGIAEK